MQHVDTGAICMQAWADAAAISETLQTGLATFYSRSRQERWCKGETSGNFINVRCSANHAALDHQQLRRLWRASQLTWHREGALQP
jgi:phosphoribosyl-AMP cyclohydrolase